MLSNLSDLDVWPYHSNLFYHANKYRISCDTIHIKNSFISKQFRQQSKFINLMTNKTLSIYTIKHSLKITLEYLYSKCQCQLFQVLLFVSFPLYEMQSNLNCLWISLASSKRFYIKMYLFIILIMADLKKLNISINISSHKKTVLRTITL